MTAKTYINTQISQIGGKMGNELIQIDEYKHKQTEIILWNTMAEARYSLNRIGESVFLDAISKVDFKKYPADHEYKIVAIEFAEDWGYNKRGNIYRDLKNIAKDLFDTYIEVPHDEFGKVGEYIHIFGRIKYDTGNGCITYVMDREIIPYLDVDTEKGHWFKFVMETRKKLKQKYSFKLYLLMKKNVYYTEMNKRIIYDVDNLKQIIFGISEDEITKDDKAKSLMEQEFYTFHSRILKLSVDEINNNTELFIEYKTIRDGKNVGKIEFFIKEKKFECILQSNKNMDMYNPKIIEFLLKEILGFSTVNKKQEKAISEWFELINPYVVYYFADKAFSKKSPFEWLRSTLGNLSKNLTQPINFLEYVHNGTIELKYMADISRGIDFDARDTDDYITSFLRDRYSRYIEVSNTDESILMQLYDITSQ